MLKAKLLVLFLLFVLIGSAFAQEEIELGDTVEGEASDEAVEYELELEEGQIVVITLSSDEFDTYLELFDEDHNFLASNDDYGDGRNSQLSYTAYDDMTLIISVRGFGLDGPDGDYELSVEEIDAELDAGSIEIGDSIEIEPNGAREIRLTFEGTEGQGVNILVTSSGGEDSVLRLEDPDGDEIAYNDDSNYSLDPAIRRFELPETGTYTIVIMGLGETSLFTELEVSLEEAQILLLNDGPQTLTLGSEVTNDFVMLDTEEDVSYLILLSFDEDIDGSLYLSIMDENLGYARSSLTVSGTSAASFVYTATDTGRSSIEVVLYTYDDEIEITIEMQVLQ
jgi:hypothetical protein